MVYVDALTGCLAHDNWRHTRSCHLMADSLPELIRFGKEIGCSPHWVQTGGSIDHFDLTARMREKAVAHGAVEIDRKQVVELMRRRSMPTHAADCAVALNGRHGCSCSANKEVPR